MRSSCWFLIKTDVPLIMTRQWEMVPIRDAGII